VSIFPNTTFLLSVASPPQFPPDVGVEVAIAGRSNAGKSSAINALLNRRGLARTSKIPGRTQLLNYFELAPSRRLVDLPGYGHAEAPDAVRATWRPLIDALRRRDSFGALMLIVDSRRGIKPEDLALLDWADLPEESVHVLLSKADQLSRTDSVPLLRDARAVLAGRASVQLFSALKGTGLDDARKVLLRWCGDKRKSPDGRAIGAD
jgi:GTP-binding protein